MNIIPCIFKGIDFAITSGVNTYQSVQIAQDPQLNDAEKGILIASQTLSSLCALADFGVHTTKTIGDIHQIKQLSSIPTEVGVGVSAANHGAKLVQTVTKKCIEAKYRPLILHDYFEILGSVIANCSAVTLDCAQAGYCGEYEKLATGLSYAGLTVGGLAFSSKQLEQFGKLIKEKFLEKGGDSLSEQEKAIVRSADDRETGERAANEMEELNVPDISYLHKIPNLLAIVPDFKFEKCPLTKQPIRHIAIVRGNKSDVYYEREKLRQHFEQNQDVAPEGWPTGLDYSKTRDDVRQFNGMVDGEKPHQAVLIEQARIDEILTLAVDDYHHGANKLPKIPDSQPAENLISTMPTSSQCNQLELEKTKNPFVHSQIKDTTESYLKETLVKLVLYDMNFQQHIYFDRLKTTIDLTDCEEAITAAADLLKQYECIHLIIEGHANSSDQPGSEDRAKHIKELIVKKGDKTFPERIKTVGISSTKPLDCPHSPANRVVIIRIDMEKSTLKKAELPKDIPCTAQLAKDPLLAKKCQVQRDLYNLCFEKHVYFDEHSVELKDLKKKHYYETNIITEAVKLLKQHKFICLSIEGYSDANEHSNADPNLNQKRAEYVKQLIVNTGSISEDRISASGNLTHVQDNSKKAGPDRSMRNRVAIIRIDIPNSISKCLEELKLQK